MVNVIYHTNGHAISCDKAFKHNNFKIKAEVINFSACA